MANSGWPPRYFGSFDDLLLAIGDDIVAEYADEVGTRLAETGPDDWWDTLGREVDLFIDYQIGLEQLHDVVFHGPVSEAASPDERPSAQSVVAELLNGGIEDGAFASVDVDVTAALLFQLVHAAADSIIAGQDRDRTVAALRRILSAALDPKLPAGWTI